MIEFQLLFASELTIEQTIRMAAIARASGCTFTGGYDIYTVKTGTGTQVAYFISALQMLIVNTDLPKVEFSEGDVII